MVHAGGSEGAHHPTIGVARSVEAGGDGPVRLEPDPGGGAPRALATVWFERDLADGLYGAGAAVPVYLVDRRRLVRSTAWPTGTASVEIVKGDPTAPAANG
ncbi:MAG: hypothetical protein ACOCR0_01720 [Haloferacaceae archaeon]